MSDTALDTQNLSEQTATGKAETTKSDPATAEADQPAGSQPDAVLFLHGIGQQQRYDTVESLVNGLLSHGKQRSAAESWTKVEGNFTAPTLILPDSPTPLNAIRLTSGSGASQRIIDFYEIYWAPLSNGATTFARVLTWMGRSSFIPFYKIGSERYAFSNASKDKTPEELRKLEWSSRQPHTKTFFDIGYVVSSLLLIAGVCALIAVFLLKAVRELSLTKIVPAILTGEADLSAVARVIPVSQVLWSISVTIAFYCLGQIGFLLYSRYQWCTSRTSIAAADQAERSVKNSAASTKKQIMPRPIAAAYESAWRSSLGLILFWSLLLVLFCAVLFFDMDFDSTRKWTLLLLIITFPLYKAVTGFVQYWFVNFLGDVQVYTEPDENSSFYKVREEIITRAMDTARGVLQYGQSAAQAGEEYAHVYIAGHSLGSVIGYDMLLRLFDEQSALAVAENKSALITPKDFSKITAFVTFGSPLSKTRFFFDTKSIHSQLRFETETRRYKLGEIFSDPHPNFVSGLPTKSFIATNYVREVVHWFNFWYPQDIVGNPLFTTFGRLTDFRLHHGISLKNPFHVWLHSDYFDDPEFVVRLDEILRGEPVETISSD